MAFADAILEAVSMPLYVFLWIRLSFWLWNYEEKLSLDISWSVVDATFSQGLLISPAAIAFSRFLRHILASETPNYVI